MSIFPCPRLDAHASILRLKPVIHLTLRHVLLWRLRYFTAAQNEACAASLPTLALEWIRWLWKTCKARGYILGTLLLSCSNYTLGCLSLVDRLSAFRKLFSCTLLFPDWTDLPLTSAPALGSLYKSSQHTRSTHQP